jgi:hypothetical protein
VAVLCFFRGGMCVYMCHRVCASIGGETEIEEEKLLFNSLFVASVAIFSFIHFSVLNSFLYSLTCLQYI